MEERRGEEIRGEKEGWRRGEERKRREERGARKYARRFEDGGAESGGAGRRSSERRGGEQTSFRGASKDVRVPLGGGAGRAGSLRGPHWLKEAPEKPAPALRDAALSRTGCY